MSERVLEVTRKATAVLASRGVADARLDAELLLGWVLGLRRLDLYLQHDRPLTGPELERYRGAIRRRLRREPLQYIVGETSFREIVLRVDRRALVPRPETEVLVGLVAAESRARAGGGVALDLGVGSGAIALSLLHEGAFERVVATDVSEEALTLAGENAQRLGLSNRLDLRMGDLWCAVADGETFDAIVSNPPYVARGEGPALAPEVRDWEPERALFAGETGLETIERIVAGAAARLVPGGLLALEVGATQGEAAGVLMEGAGFTDVRIAKDLAGRERVALGRRPECG
ncbi:MAG TPA: peptide chain release factor N(5)-glutamine methyltransferase [Longimicrobiales bacterium]|nr:peptide chain release factor N(5)-glutamine methyltransferase [Longimicrobiales bacterium]